MFVEPTGHEKVRAFPESETKLFLRVVDAQLTFTKDDSGAVTGLVLHQGGRERVAKKVK